MGEGKEAEETAWKDKDADIGVALREYSRVNQLASQEEEAMIAPEWSEWRQFPDPRNREMLVAPFGPGCYELRHGTQLVLFGRARHVAERMTSLLPRPFGCGTRTNHHKRNYVFDHLGGVEYRTLACATADEAKKCERGLRINRADYRFQT